MADVTVWTGAVVNAVRKAMRLSQSQFAERVRVDQRTISSWECGKNRPISAAGSRALDELLDELTEGERRRFEQMNDSKVVSFGNDDGMDRRHFLQAAALAPLASPAPDLLASLAGGDPGPLALVQTSYTVDHTIAAALDHATMRRMLLWAQNDPSEIIRVNAAGILAKTTDAPAETIAGILAHDHDVSRRYMTAVLSRVLDIDHGNAAGYVIAPETLPSPEAVAAKLATESINRHDVGARWCAATMLARMSPYLR
ncbi:helix-turn-helix domain-containing protein [Nocardia higoensis]|uniref:helix-turn-helix domain-containing protein n=1 Tax=Nocardia higoensis TaxID=228599 RepID=UPI00031F4737|nr:helix-turn-helix transcriptional regulator [Nocardia higoensis]